ncbi:uncharacterized protein LOC123312313 [Coccinella septempunctata]|uniref:uncharacterized protein LOC123312313 n=1 Tax=Coccinella septempunctata TaxID=41139 RepID=UPI001D087584|nr:uncharacterized protein LOC123312313 [Coccinella septempunctata]
MEVAICTNNVEEDSITKAKTQNISDMTSSTTSMTSSLSSPVDSGVQLLDSESEGTSVMSASGTGCEMESILVSYNESSKKNARIEQNDPKRLTVIDLTETNNQTECTLNNTHYGNNEHNEIETNELKCQMDLFEKEFGIASIKEYFMCNKENIENGSTLDLFSENLSYKDKLELYTKQNTIVGSNSSPCLRNSTLLDFGARGGLNKSLSDDVFEMEHPIQGKLEPTTTEADLMNVSLTSYELLDYTSQNLVLPALQDSMNVSVSEEVNENLCTQLKTNIKQVEENIEEVPVIEPEPKAADEQIVYRRQRKKKSKSDTPKKRVSFHEDILNSTKIDDIHINHGFITHEPDVSFSFFQRGFIRKPDVVKGRYSWAAEGDAPYYEKQVSNRKTNSDMYIQNQKYSSTSSSSTGSISSSIDEEDSSDENVPKKNPPLSQPKSSCLKKTSKKRTIDTKIVHEEINIPRQKSENNLLDSNIFGSLKNILTFSTSVPLAERGVPEGQEDIPIYSSGNEKSSRRRSCTNFSFLETDGMVIEEEPVKRRGNLNLEVAKSNFRLSRSEGFYPNYPVEQQLPPNIILCDSNVYEHKGISYSYEYDNFQKTFEQQNKPKSSTLYQFIMKEFNFFRNKSKEEPEKEAREEAAVLTSTPSKNNEEAAVETSPTDRSSKSLLSTYASSSKLDWSDNDATLSEFSEATHSRHLNSPKKRINRSNHYSTQSSFKITSESDCNPFLSKNETVSRPSTSKSSLIDRFLRNVTLKKILDVKSAKRHKNDRKYLSLYVKGVKGKFGYDEVDRELEKEIINGLKKKEANAVVYDKRMITQLKREVFRSQLETFIRLFMVRSAYTPKGDSKPLLAILTNAALYITSLISGGRYRNHFFLPYTDLSTILIGPNGQTIHISNFKQDMQCMITTGCMEVTNDFISQLGMAMRKDINKPCLPAVKQLTMHDMVNLRKTICKQTAVQKDEEYVYYSIVDIQELSADIEDSTPHGPTKEGPLMFRTKESNPRWETAYFILKAGVLYMLSSASNRVPMMVYPLINGACQGARRLPNSPRPHTFQIIVNGKNLQLAAPDEYVASEWLQALIHAANGTHFKDKLITQSCSLLMTTEHILTVREAFPCTLQTLFLDELEQELMNGTQALSCASILDLVSFRLPSAEQSWCILEFACREVYECGGDWILYFASNAELENFISTLEVLWDYNNEKGESFPLSTIPETDPLSKKCIDVYMSLRNSWSSNTVHLQFL